jgi:hypothetical protein
LEAAGEHLDEAAVLHAQTDGNPLAVLELTATHTPGQITGADPLPNGPVVHPGGLNPSVPLTNPEFRIASDGAGVHEDEAVADKNHTARPPTSPRPRLSLIH